MLLWFFMYLKHLFMLYLCFCTVIQKLNLLLVFKYLFSVTVASEPDYKIEKVSLYDACNPTDHPLSATLSPVCLPSSTLPLTMGSWTSELDPSPSLCVLITGPSVKHQRPSSPAGLCCQTGLRYRQQKRKTEREKWKKKHCEFRQKQRNDNDIKNDIKNKNNGRQSLILPC